VVVLEHAQRYHLLVKLGKQAVQQCKGPLGPVRNTKRDIEKRARARARARAREKGGGGGEGESENSRGPP
jgi:hypothetical protein